MQIIIWIDIFQAFKFEGGGGTIPPEKFEGGHVPPPPHPRDRRLCIEAFLVLLKESKV